MKKSARPIFLTKLDKITFKKIYTREYGVQYSEMAIRCLGPDAKHHVPKTSVDHVVAPSENSSSFYIDENAWQALVNSLDNKYTQNVKQLKKYEDQFIFDGEAYLKIAKKISKIDLTSLNNLKLKQLYVQYQKKLFLYSIFAWTAFILNNFIAEKATKIIDKYLKMQNREEDKQKIYQVIFSPPKRAAVLELQHQVRKIGKPSTQEFNKLFHQFRWLPCLDVHNEPWTKSQFKKQIRSFKSKSQDKLLSFKAIANQLKINKLDLEYLVIARQFVYIKDARDDYRRQGVYYAQNLLRELASRIDIAKADVSYLQEEEIINFLSGDLKISKQLIKQRKKGFVLYFNTKMELSCQTSESVKQLIKLLRLPTDKQKKTKIKGMVASRGKAQGKVVIVKSVKEINKVKDGDVLVAVTTNPDYVIAMKKAVAIITDEGGITSHAAIVSRELQIPCVVGTKQATLLLKNGDMVEVDAEKGEVKVLD